VILIAILLVGPFALPLVWKSPSLNLLIKILVTILVIAATVWFFMVSAEIYQALLKELKDLEKVLK
jgi:hypothetical protein